MTTSGRDPRYPPFELSQPMQQLLVPYPGQEQLRKVAQAVSNQERDIIVRLWVSEGIPYAFRDCPALYDASREWLSRRIPVSPKEITIIGSGRLGYSLKPDAWGRSFGPHSDLDLSFVSESLFGLLKDEFVRFSQEFEDDIVHPRNEHERSMWKENLRIVPNAVARGVIDPKKVPSWNRYPTSQGVLDSLWRLQRRLAQTVGSPEAKRVTVRVYDGWNRFTNIVVGNLRRAALHAS